MTRGFIVLTKKGKIYKIVESYSDSYLSGLGLDVLKIFEENNFEEAFKNILEVDLDDVYEEGEISPISVVLGENTTDTPLKSLPYVKKDFVSSKDGAGTLYHDYTYMYDVVTDILKVYYYGDLYLTIKRNDIDLYKHLINNDELYYELSYDEKSCSLKKNHVKEIKKFLKTNPTKQDIDNIKSSFKPKLFISEDKCSDCWGSDSYQKTISDLNYNKVMTFIISKKSYSNKWSLVIQLPYIRNTIFNGTTSNVSCEKKLIELIKTKELELINFAILSKEVSNCIKKLHEVKKLGISNHFSIESKKLKEELFKFIDNFYKENDFFQTQSFTTTTIKKEINSLCYDLHLYLVKEENKNTLCK